MFQSNIDNYDFEQSYNLDICQYGNILNHDLESIDFMEKHRTTNDSEISSEPSDNQYQQLKSAANNPIPQRKINRIQISICQMLKLCSSKKGENLDTLNMSKNIKTITSNFLKLLIMTRQTSIQETSAILNYNSKNGSLETYEQLFSFRKIREKSLQFYSSKFFVQNVLSSSKMQFQNKILLIKFLEKIRSNTWKQLKNWKTRNGLQNQ